MRPIFLVVFLLFAMTMVFSGQDRSYGRSVVMTERGIVATSHYLASQAGAQILAEGGTAMDAAIAANAVLGVTEPMNNGIGGDLFLIYWDAKSGKLYGLNSSGWAPQGLTPEHLRAKGAQSMPVEGIDAVTVPGTVAGWNALHGKFGKLDLKEVLRVREINHLVVQLLLGLVDVLNELNEPALVLELARLRRLLALVGQGDPNS